MAVYWYINNCEHFNFNTSLKFELQTLLFKYHRREVVHAIAKFVWNVFKHCRMQNGDLSEGKMSPPAFPLTVSDSMSLKWV